MGKRYYCDYCDKTMSCAPSIIKTHNNGLVHQKNVQDHYQIYKDPELILDEENAKFGPCKRIREGKECIFGLKCRFTHYSVEQLNQLQQIVQAKKLSKETPIPCFQELYNKLTTDKSLPKQVTVIMDSNGEMVELPWTNNPAFKNYEVPLSLKEWKLEDFNNVEFSEWG